MSKPFLPKEDLQAALVQTLPPAQRDLYQSLRHARAEPCFRGRLFIIYRIEDRQCVVLDTLEVLDFVCNDAVGASMEVMSRGTGKVFTVGYKPTQVLDYPVFIFMPLYLKTRWCANEDQVSTGGQLGFDVIIRTRSRYHKRERGVTYCETRTEWMEEFGSAAIEA